MTERQQDDSPTTLVPSTYFRSPLLTIVSSIDSDDVPVPDILDAYSILSVRIQSLASSLVLTTCNLPALGVIAQFSEPLARRLQQDIRRALEDPFTPASSMSPMISRGVMAPLATDLSGDAAHTAREVSLLSQYALRIAATVFRFPRLHSLFSDATLRRLLDDVLVVARSYDLPCIDSEKVCAMATSAFSVVQLPPNIFESCREALTGWIRELADCMSPRTENSKVIHHLLSTYPSVFLPDTGHVLPAILTGIVSTNMRDRIDASVALSGYALAFLSVGSSFRNLPDVIAKQIWELLRRPLPAHTGTDSKKDTLLSHLIDRAIKEDTPETPQNVGCRWAVTVVCSLICLTGHKVFSGTTACGLVFQTAEGVYLRKPKGCKELLACLWRCLVWAFSKLPYDGTNGKDHRAGPLGTVKQEVRFGAGSCLIASLLYRPPGHQHESQVSSSVDVGRAVSVLKTMVDSCDYRVHRDGVWVLAKMCSGIGSGDVRKDTSRAGSWVPDDLIVKAMFARRMATVDATTFASALRKAISNRPEIRPLEEAEVQRYWDALRDAWVVGVRRVLQHDQFSSLSDELATTWQALLLVRTHLTQERAHLTATEEFTDSAITIIAEFLDWSLQEPAKVAPLTTTTAQTRALTLCVQLWSIVRNVFSEAWLSQAANTLLTDVLQRTFVTSSEDVKAAWSRMCAALICASSPGLVARLVTEDEEHRTLELRRELWNLAAKSWPSLELQPSVEDCVEFLCTPVGVWSPTEQEMTAWEDILDRTISQAAMTAGSAATVFDSLIQRVCGDEGASSLIRVPWLIIRILSRWRAAGDCTSTLLGTVAASLVELYPDPDGGELDARDNLDAAMRVIEHVWKTIKECPPASMMSLLLPLADGLAVWVSDKQYLSEQEYSRVIVPLYCDALKALRIIPIDSDTLHALARFLCSTFHRCPPPNGPLAFRDFWTEVQPSLQHLDGEYPEELLTALYACHKAFGTSLPSNASISIETESQPESQATQSVLLTSPGFFGTPSKRVESPVAGAEPLTRSSQPFIRSPALSTGNSSPAGQPNASWLPTASKHHSHRSHELSDPESPTPARRRHGASRSSEFPPSSPTDAMRARRFAAGSISRVSHERPSKTPDRPLKRRKLSPTATPNASPGSSVRRHSPLVNSPEDSRRSQGPVAMPMPSRWRVAGDESQSRRSSRQGASTSGMSTPQSSPSRSKLKEEQLLSPEVPSPPIAARARSRAAVVDDGDDDYDAWEIPIATDDDFVPDSQPEGENDDEDSLVPSFMRVPSNATQPVDDTMDADDDYDDYDSLTGQALGKRPERRSPLRMQTAPATFIHDRADSMVEEARVLMRRARTESVPRLEELRDICEALEEGGSQLGVDEMLTASRYTSRMGAILSEKLSKKLSSGGSPTGSARSHGRSARSKE